MLTTGVHPFNIYLLSAYFMPRTVLGTDIQVSENMLLLSGTLQYSGEDRRAADKPTDNRHITTIAGTLKSRLKHRENTRAWCLFQPGRLLHGRDGSIIACQPESAAR